MRYIKNGVVAADPWCRVADDQPLPRDVPTIISATRLQIGHELASHSQLLGVIWPNDRAISDLAPHLERLALVALVFPIFRDGRAYSQARQLREQYSFTGEVRATGHVLRDQFLFMVRAGFDAFEVQKPDDVAAFSRALHEFSVFYQPAADLRTTALQARLLGRRI